MSDGRNPFIVYDLNNGKNIILLCDCKGSSSRQLCIVSLLFSGTFDYDKILFTDNINYFAEGFPLDDRPEIIVHTYLENPVAVYLKDSKQYMVLFSSTVEDYDTIYPGVIKCFFCTDLMNPATYSRAYTLFKQPNAFLRYPWIDVDASGNVIISFQSSVNFDCAHLGRSTGSNFIDEASNFFVYKSVFKPSYGISQSDFTPVYIPQEKSGVWSGGRGSVFYDSTTNSVDMLYCRGETAEDDSAVGKFTKIITMDMNASGVQPKKYKHLITMHVSNGQGGQLVYLQADLTAGKPFIGTKGTFLSIFGPDTAQPYIDYPVIGFDRYSNTPILAIRLTSKRDPYIDVIRGKDAGTPQGGWNILDVSDTVMPDPFLPF